MKNNTMITLKMLSQCFESNEVTIPLIQRNYKWSAVMAGSLVNDIWQAYKNGENEYTIGMLTLYQENDGKMQLIDGQQRVITLTLLFGFLDSGIRHFKFFFERDEGVTEERLKRSEYLRGIGRNQVAKEERYTDLERFQKNYEEIKTMLMKSGYVEADRSPFIQFVLEHVYVLFHVTEVEPIDEFLNINKNKTRFGIADHIKANMIIDSGKNMHEIEKGRNKVMSVFKKLSGILYSNDLIWEAVGQGYQIKENADKKKNSDGQPEENRLNILFSDRYKDNSKNGYEYVQEMQRLSYYLAVIAQLVSDINLQNWNAYNGWICLSQQSNVRFFNLIGEEWTKKCGMAPLEKVLWEYVRQKSSIVKNLFVESQLGKERMEPAVFKSMSHMERDIAGWVYLAESELEYFDGYYQKYIDEKYKTDNTFLGGIHEE